MYTQMFNGQFVFVVTSLEFIGFVMAFMLLFLFAFLFMAITKPVSMPYLKAWMGKSKYLALYLDRSHRIYFAAADMKGNIVSSPAIKDALFIKHDHHGSYKLGNVNCDIYCGDSAVAYDDDYACVMQELKLMGINDEKEACRYFAQFANDPEYKLFDERTGAHKRLLDVLAELNINPEIFLPKVTRKMDLVDFSRWCVTGPQQVKAYVVGEIEEWKRKLSRRDGSPKGGMSPMLLITLVVLGVGGLIAFSIMGGT